MLSSSVEGSPHRRVTRVVAAFAVVGVLATALIGSGPMAGKADASTSGFRFNRIEKCFMEKVNSFRRKHGLSALRADPQLAKKARGWASKMADARELSHPPTSWYMAISGWTNISDNVGRGSSCKSITRAFKASLVHRTNILMPGLDFMGAGTKRTGSGKIYVQQVFTSGSNPGL